MTDLAKRERASSMGHGIVTPATLLYDFRPSE